MVSCPVCGKEAAVLEGRCTECGAPIDLEKPTYLAHDPSSKILGLKDDSSEANTGVRDVSEDVTRAGDSAASAAPSSQAGYLEPGQSFGPRYSIIRILGTGGMGAVYQAWDEELLLAVALKVILPNFAANATAAKHLEDRFKRELLLARKVTHKNVVRIHDIGEIDGIKYITMSYVEGDDLETILNREGKLPVPRALGIARQIVAGLNAAHEAGVIHRDLKPANIMVDVEGEALIMDFGIARPTLAPGPAPGEESARADPRRQPELLAGVTKMGTVVGTIEYMAPEQARGEKVDQRADIYAFGLIFYDLLVGKGRFTAGLQGLAALKQRMEQPPLSARSLDPQIPEALDRVITRCLEPDTSARFASVSELEQELDGLDDEGHPLPVAWRFSLLQIAASVLVAVMVVVGTWWFARTPVPPVQPAPMSVLIANFDNRTGDTVFEGSLEQALAVGVEAASFLTAFPRHDALQVASDITPGGTLDEQTARLVSMREDIKVVLAGSIEAEGSGYSVSVKAIDPSVDEPLLTAKAPASSKDDVLETVSSLAARVRKALGDTAADSEADAGRETFTVASLEAARSYSLGKDLQRSYKDQEAIEHFEQAVERDPNFGRAYAGWANSAFRLGRTEESEQAWEKALSHMDRMTEREKYRTLGVYYGTISRNYEKVIENFETLLELYPADGAGHNNLALAYFNTRKFDKALQEGRRALEIYPTRLLYRGNYALFAMYASDFTTAEDEANRIVDENPEYYPAYLPLSIGALSRSDFGAAGKTYGRLAETGAPGASLASLGLADLALYRGRFDEAADILTRGIADDAEAKNQALMAAKYVALAEAYRGSGKKERALAAVENALQLRRREEVLFPAARILRWGERRTEAQELALELGSQLEPQRRAYAKIIEGEIALQQGRTVTALEAFQSAQALADLWLVRFDLGILYVGAGRHPEALSELEICEKRKGEATAIFLDDVPTYRYLAPLPYWLGRAQEGLGMKAAAAESYDAFLSIRRDSSGDPLVEDARLRRDESNE